jgi:hypothetical protein
MDGTVPDRDLRRGAGPAVTGTGRREGLGRPQESDQPGERSALTRLSH